MREGWIEYEIRIKEYYIGDYINSTFIFPAYYSIP